MAPWPIVLLLGCQDPPPRDREPVARMVTGGTLALLDEEHVLAADPEGDRLLVLELGDGLRLANAIDLGAGAFPARVAAGKAGIAWVVLRGHGALARVDLGEGSVISLSTCHDPRGLWVEADGGPVVTCADGTLLALTAEGDIRSRIALPDDLRDVVRIGDELWISRFRRAEILRVRDDHVLATVSLQPTAALTFEASVAWRMVPDPTTGGVIVAHQRSQATPVSIDAEAAFGSLPYGGPGCDAVVQTSLTRVHRDGSLQTLAPISKQVLPVDIAPRRDGTLALAAAGAGGLSDVAVGIVSPATWDQPSDCTTLPGLPWSGIAGDTTDGGRVTAVVETLHGLVVQTQSPLTFALAPNGGVIERLDFDEPTDRGVGLFHLAPTASVACASCHPEGLEDGRVWQFRSQQRTLLRRTQSLAGGGIDATSPLHWDGSLADLEALLADTLARRIGGRVEAGDADALRELLRGALPPRSTPNPADVVAGKAVWDLAGCSTCHAGPWTTDNLAHDVGTGQGAVQTPSLRGVGLRGPWLSNGCATTLEERFDPEYGGDRHGDVASRDIPALVAWLQSL